MLEDYHKYEHYGEMLRMRRLPCCNYLWKNN